MLIVPLVLHGTGGMEWKHIGLSVRDLAKASKRFAITPFFGKFYLMCQNHNYALISKPTTFNFFLARTLSVLVVQVGFHRTVPLVLHETGGIGLSVGGTCRIP